MSISVSSSAAPWSIVNDGVMGGVSTSQINQVEDFLRFSGDLSLENNGGFASVRRPVDGFASDVAAVRITVRGDGRTYQFRLRTGREFDGIAWRQEFPTTNDWQTLELAMSDFVPVFRGRQLNGVGPLQATAVRQLGLLLADKNPGFFRLDIKQIEFVADSD